MSDYGKRDKRISFMDTDKRNADLMIRLKHDGLTKTKFFRAVLTAYLEGDPNFMNFIWKYKGEQHAQSKRQAKIVKDSITGADKIKRKFGLEDKEIENIFDILEKEHPDL